MLLILADTGSANRTTILLFAAIVLIIVLVLLAGWFLARRAAKAEAAAEAKSEVIAAPLSLTLRFLSDDHATVIVRVQSAGTRADLYMRNGILYHAVSAGGQGNAAAADALRWDSSSTKVTVIRDAVMPIEQTITLSLRSLLSAAGVSN